MPLVKMTTIMKEVDAKKTAALAFDCYNYDSIEWVIEVGQELNLPVIIMLYPEMSKYMSHEAFAAATIAEAKRLKIPVALHQDHCQSYETIMRAIKAGFTSVMFDAQNFLMKKMSAAPVK